MIPYGRQQVTDDDIAKVVETLKSDFLTQGSQVPIFEEKLSNITRSKFVTAVNSATSALHIACLAIGVGKGDVVWTTPTTFVASANCALYCGAKVDFVDIDPITSNMSIDNLEQKLIIAKKLGSLPKVVIPVHLTGESCNMKEIKKLSIKFGFYIIEDASHALGGSYNNSPIGSCAYSDIAIFSFHPVKIITTCEGGAALTNNEKLDQKMKLYRSHGITREKSLMKNPNPTEWYYEQQVLGFNYRMSDIHAVLGSSQINRLSDIIAKRHKIADIYDIELKNMNVSLPYRNPLNHSALHLYAIRVEPSRHEKIFDHMRSNGISVNLHYIPVHTHPYYRNLGFDWGSFPNAENYYRETISLPIYPTLSNEDQDAVIKQLQIITHG